MALVLTTTAFGADEPEIFVQMGHSTSIKSVAFTSNGAYLVSGSEDKTIKIWETQTGKEFRTLRHTGQINALALSSDSRLILTGDEKGVINLWDLQTGKALGKFAGQPHSGVTSLEFSRDGKHAVSTHYGNLVYWEVKTRKQIFDLDRQTQRFSKGISAQIMTASFLTEGRTMVLGVQLEDKHYKSRGLAVEIFDIQKRKSIRNCEILKGEAEIQSLAVSPDEKYFWVLASMARSSDIFDRESRLLVVDARTGGVLQEIKLPERFFHLTFSPDGRMAAASNFKEVLVYDTLSRTMIKKFNGRLPVTFSSDGRFLLYGNNSEMAYDGETVYKEGLDLVDLATDVKVRRFAGNADFVTSARFVSSDREILAVNRLGLFWNLQKASLIRTISVKDTASRPLFPSAVSDDGRFLIVQNDHGCYRYSTQDGRLVDIHNKPLAKSVFGPGDKTLLIATYERKIGLMDLETFMIQRQFADWSAKEKLFIDYIRLSQDGRYVVASFHDYEKTGPQNVIVVWEAQTGREVNRYDIQNSICSLILSPDGRSILTGEFSGITDDYRVVLRSSTERRVIREFRGHQNLISSLAFSRDARRILSGSWDQKVILWDAESGRQIRTFTGHAGLVESLAFSADEKSFVSASRDGTVRVWDIAGEKERVRLITFTDGEWIALTPEGYYNASPGGDRHINVRVGGGIYSVDNYREAFFRPDLVKLALSGGALTEFRKMSDVGKPPVVKMVDMPSAVFSDEVTLRIMLEDQGGGIGDIRIYLNGAAVTMDSRAVAIRAKTGAALEKSYRLKLVSGKNLIKAVAFNADNSMQSNEATCVVQATYKQTEKPSLYALVIGINDFKNPKLKLQYSAADADLFAATLQKGSAGLFDNVSVKKLTKPEETTGEAILREIKAFQSLRPDDVFVFYIASHGTVDEGEYFLITSNVGSLRTEKLKTDAISQHMLKEAIANIPATKKLIVIDTCNAGALGEAIQTAMLTRGMSEDTAFKILSRAVGSTILSASTSVQEALEGYQGHGLFTWVLAEGLSGKADKGKTGYVKTTELADYVDNEVPALAEKVFKRAQYPTISISGQAFPIGKTR
jgi:WD40 repeat protein